MRRVKDARYRDALFPVWRYHPFFTNTDAPVSNLTLILINPMSNGVLPIQILWVIHTLLKRQSHTREEATLE